MEVRRPRRQRAQRRSLEAADVLPLAGHQRPARIGGLRDRAGRLVSQGVERHVRRSPARVGQADVERQRHRVVAGVGRVVAGRAGALDHRHAEVVVQAGDAGDGDRLAVEQRLAARDRLARDGDTTAAPFAVTVLRVFDVGLPALVERHRVRVERGVAAVVAHQRVVDAEIRDGTGQERRAAVRAVHVQPAGVVVLLLRRMEAELEVDDRVALVGGERLGPLRMAQRRVVRLRRQIEVQRREANRRIEDAIRRRGIALRFAAVPHDCAEEAPVRRRQGPAVQREFGGRCVAVRIVDGGELELGVHRNRQADADQALAQQHAVARLACTWGRHVDKRRVGAVVHAKDRVGAARLPEPFAQTPGRDRPSFVRLMAGDAGALVGAELAEEWIAAIDEAVGADRHRHAAVVVGAVELSPVRSPAVVVVACPGCRKQARRHEYRHENALACLSSCHSSPCGSTCVDGAVGPIPVIG